MTEHRQVSEEKKNIKKPHPNSRESFVIAEQQDVLTDVKGFQQRVGNRAVQNLLGDPEITARTLKGTSADITQRRALTSFGQVQGNRYLQRMLAGVETGTIQRMLQRDPDDGPGDDTQAGTPEGEQPSSGETGLEVGSLRLELGPLQQLPIEDTFSPDRLFQPSPELVRQLVDDWHERYRLTYTGPPMAEDAWQQLWSAWRRLTDQWLARGADAPLNAELARDMLRDQAAQEVINRQSGGGEVSLSSVAGSVWPAFQRALEATQFYPRIRQNAETLIQQHWPALIPTLGTALGAAIGMGVQGNDWRVMEQLSTLLPMLSHDIPLGGNWRLTLGFAESQRIWGTREQGTVLGVNPSISFTYQREDIQFSVGGSANLRIETGPEIPGGVHVNANPGGQIMIRY